MLSGAVTTVQLESNVDAVAIRLSAEVLGQLTALAEAPSDYWAERSRRPWN